jgi:hypothetical protein
VLDRLIGARAKVDRAKLHLRELETENGSYFDSNPYEIRTKRDPNTRRLIYYIASAQPPPVAIAAIAGDILQNLRSALDHLAYQLVLVGSGSVGPFNYVYFPIADSAEKYESRKIAQLKGARQDAIYAVEACKPYKGGDDTLWLIHRLNNIDKHRLLVTVGSAFRSLDIGGHVVRKMAKDNPHLGDIPALSAFFKPADRMCPIKIGDELFIDMPDAEVDQEMQFRFELAFNEPQISEGEPILERLAQMLVTVDNLLTRFAPLL